MRKIKKGKEAIMALEMVFMIVITTILIAFIIDLMILSWKTTVMSETISMVTRTVGIQGGIQTAPPPNYPGQKGAYLTSAEVYEKVLDNLKTASIKESDFKLIINGKQFTSAGTGNNPFDYQQRIEIRSEMNFKWQMTSFYFGDISHTAKQRRTTTSEYKRDW